MKAMSGLLTLLSLESDVYPVLYQVMLEFRYRISALVKNAGGERAIDARALENTQQNARAPAPPEAISGTLQTSRPPPAARRRNPRAPRPGSCS